MKKALLTLIFLSALAEGMTLNTIDQITATVLSGTSVRVDWIDNASSVSGYRVERCSSNCALISGSWSLVSINPSGVKSFTDTGLSTGTTYHWRVAEDPYMSASATPTSTTTTTIATTTTTTTIIGTSGLVGWVPGTGDVDNMVSDGTRVFMGSKQFGVSVVTVSGLVPIGGPTTPFYGGDLANGIAISGTTIAVKSQNSGIKILDATDPSRLILKSTIIGDFKGVQISGSTLYTTVFISGNPGSSKFRIYNISSLTNPTQVGSDLAIGPSATLMKCSAGYCYIAGDIAGLLVVDATNINAPSFCATLNTPDKATDISLTGSTVYVADTTSLRVVNISTPCSPSETSSLAQGAIGVTSTSSGRVAIADGFGVRLVDASSTPIVRTTIPSVGRRVLFFDANTLLVSDSTRGSDSTLVTHAGLTAYDVTNFSAPFLIGNVFGAATYSGMAVNASTGIAVMPNQGLGNATGTFIQPSIKVVDLSIPTGPIVRASINDLNRTFVGAAISGQRAYAAEVVSGNPATVQLLVIDISNPGSPAIRGRVTVAGSWYEMEARGTLVYLPQRAGGFQIVDVSNDTSPFIRATYDTPGSVQGIDFSGSDAFVADTTAVLAINVSNPASPTQRSSLAVSCSNISVLGIRAYCVDGANLRTIDISNPNAMAQLSSTSSRGSTYVVATGTRIYGLVGSQTHLVSIEGIQVWDQGSGTNPPVFVRQIITPRPYQNIALGPQGTIITGDEVGILGVTIP